MRAWQSEQSKLIAVSVVFVFIVANLCAKKSARQHLFEEKYEKRFDGVGLFSDVSETRGNSAKGNHKKRKMNESNTNTNKDRSFHAMALATMRSNGWDYAYALGYVSGKCDAADGRPREHRTSEHDDYALGYHKGYAVSA